MSRAAAIGLILAPFLAGCHGTPALPDAKPTMTLESASFAAGQPIPAKYGADGGNVSPELHWSAPPAGTKAFTLVVEDPDAPGGSPFIHWVVYNIPATANAFPESQPADGALVGQNDAGTTGYFGPKPPSGTHHYHFRIYALDKASELQAGASAGQVIGEMSGHQLGMGELVGTFTH